MTESRRYLPLTNEQVAETTRMRRLLANTTKKTDKELVRILYDILENTGDNTSVRQFADHPNGLKRSMEILRKAGL